MLNSVTFDVASRQNIKDPLGLYNPSLFLNVNGTRLRWTSSLVFLDHKRVMMPSLSSSTDSPRLLTFCLSRSRALLVNWQTCMFPESCRSMVFHWRSVPTMAAFSLQDS